MSIYHWGLRDRAGNWVQRQMRNKRRFRGFCAGNRMKNDYVYMPSSFTLQERAQELTLGKDKGEHLGKNTEHEEWMEATSELCESSVRRLRLSSSSSARALYGLVRLRCLRFPSRLHTHPDDDSRSQALLEPYFAKQKTEAHAQDHTASK